MVLQKNWNVLENFTEHKKNETNILLSKHNQTQEAETPPSSSNNFKKPNKIDSKTSKQLKISSEKQSKTNNLNTIEKGALRSYTWDPKSKTNSKRFKSLDKSIKPSEITNKEFLPCDVQEKKSNNVVFANRVVLERQLEKFEESLRDELSHKNDMLHRLILFH